MDYKDYETTPSEAGFWWRAKNQMIDMLMLECCKGRTDLKILNLGSGTGSDLKILNKYGKVYVVDIEKKALRLIPKELCHKKKIANACKLPYKNNFFDTVVSFDVFEHIKDDYKSVSEVKRVLKKNGVLIFSVPAFQFLFSSHDRALDHKRRYNKKMLKKLFAEFNELNMSYWNFALFFPVALMRLLKKKSKAKVELRAMPKIIDYILFSLLTIENQLMKYKISPFVGLSIKGFCRK